MHIADYAVIWCSAIQLAAHEPYATLRVQKSHPLPLCHRQLYKDRREYVLSYLHTICTFPHEYVSRKIDAGCCILPVTPNIRPFFSIQVRGGNECVLCV